MKKYNFLILFILLVSSQIHAKFLNYDKVITNNKGVELYQKDNIQEAQDSFSNNSLKNPKDGYLRYNLGNTDFKNGDYKKAIDEYKMALNDKNFDDRSAAYQNIGNSFFNEQDYEKALQSYKNAIIEDHENQSARYNYELASRFLQRQQNQKQKQNQQSDKNKDDKDDKKKEEQQQQQQNKDKPKEDEKKEQKQQQPQDMKKQEKEDAEKMLKAILAEEKQKMEEEKKKEKAGAIKSGHYW